MNKKNLLLSCLMLAAVPAMAEYTGHVYVDKNQNGIWDKGEKPMAGVKVSDGLNVVETATDGSFTLPGHERERFIFITTPSGYKTFNRHYRKIEGNSEGYEFGLMPYNAGISRNGAHRFVHISDTEIFNTKNHEDWIGNLRDYASNEQAAFIIHTGDICYENGLNEHIKLMNTRNMDCPVFYCIGNHDLVKGKYGEEIFENNYGPVYYSFDAGNVHYIVTPMMGGDYRPGYTSDDVCRWLKSDLEHVTPGTPVIVFNHDLLTYGNDFVYKSNNSGNVNLNEHNLKAWLYGHWHINYIKKQGDVHSICTSSLDKGGIDHSTSAFRIMHVDGKGDFRSELRYTYLDNNICIAAPAGEMSAGTIPVAVNVYASATPATEVTYTCTDANGKTVARKSRLGQSTDWSWNGQLTIPESHVGQELTLHVHARFANGKEIETTGTFTCRAEKNIPSLVSDWDNLLGNASHAAPTGDTLHLPLRMAWSTNVGANLYMTSPLIHKGKVYVASVDENLQGKAHVYALDGTDGRLLWSYQVRNSVKNTIAIDNDIVFAQDAQGYLYAIDAETGRLRWEKHMPVNGLPALIGGLVAENGVVYAGTGKALGAYETTTGKLLWKNEGWNQGEGATSTLTLGNGLLIGSAQWSALHGNDAETGKHLWRRSDNGLRHRGSSPAMHGSLLYLLSEKSFFIMEASTGRVVARKALPYNVDVTSTPLLTDSEIIFGSAQNGLIALDNETLEEKWTCPIGDALIYTSPYTRQSSATIETSPVLAGKTVFVTASDGTLYAVDKSNGQIQWKHSTGAPIFGSVAMSGNAVVISDFGGNVYMFCGQ